MYHRCVSINSVRNQFTKIDEVSQDSAEVKHLTIHPFPSVNMPGKTPEKARSRSLSAAGADCPFPQGARPALTEPSPSLLGSLSALLFPSPFIHCAYSKPQWRYVDTCWIPHRALCVWLSLSFSVGVLMAWAGQEAHGAPRKPWGPGRRPGTSRPPHSPTPGAGPLHPALGYCRVLFLNILSAGTSAPLTSVSRLVVWDCNGRNHCLILVSTCLVLHRPLL